MDEDVKKLVESVIDERVDQWTALVDSTIDEFANLAEKGGETWSLTDGSDYFINVKAVNQIAKLERDNAAKALAAKDYMSADRFAELAYVLQALVRTAFDHA